MIQGAQFDHRGFLQNAIRVNRPIDFTRPNVALLKSTVSSVIYCGLVIGVICLIPFLIAFIMDEASLLSLLVSLFGAAIIGSIVCYFLLSARLDVTAYFKLKQIAQSPNYQVYRYQTEIKSIYQAARKVYREESVSGRERSTGFILRMEGQKIYLDKKDFETIMFDKEIILYFAKNEEHCVLYDYERVAAS